MVWASTTLDGPGGVAAYGRLIRESAVWQDWGIRHVSTHRTGTKWQKVIEFAQGTSRFLGMLVSDRPAAVHVHMASYGSFVRKATLVWLARLFLVPVIIHMHGGYFGQFHDESPWPVRAAITTTLQRADAIIALGEGAARTLARIAPTARILVIPNPTRVEEPVRRPPAGQPVSVAFLGDVTEAKGAFGLLEAWARVLAVVDSAQPPRLTIAGNGEVAAARARARELRLGDGVRIPGWISPAQARELLVESEILALPSQYESQPMAILEAMAHGLCVVATSVGGIPEMIDGDSGILVPPDNVPMLAAALAEVVDDRPRRIALGDRARERAREKFALEVVARQLDQLYREVAR